jgi:hypothetical protein
MEAGSYPDAMGAMNEIAKEGGDFTLVNELPFVLMFS